MKCKKCEKGNTILSISNLPVLDFYSPIILGFGGLDNLPLSWLDSMSLDRGYQKVDSTKLRTFPIIENWNDVVGLAMSQLTDEQKQSMLSKDLKSALTSIATRLPLKYTLKFAGRYSYENGGNMKKLAPGGLVDYMNSKGMDSSIDNRRKLAASAGILDYAGSAEQNQRLLLYLLGNTQQSVVNTPVNTNKYYNKSWFVGDNDDMIHFSSGDNKGVNASVTGAYSGNPVDWIKLSQAPVGHAGVLVSDNEGNLFLYDYGRYKDNTYGYHSPKGNVRKFRIGHINSFIKDNTLDEKSMFDAIYSKNWNGVKSGNRPIQWILGARSGEDALNYYETLANNRNRDAYSATGNNCTSTACRASGAHNTMQVGTPGNEGFWIPRQGLAAMAQNMIDLVKSETVNHTGGPMRFGLNDVMAYSPLNKVVSTVQGGIDLARGAVNKTKELYNNYFNQ